MAKQEKYIVTGLINERTPFIGKEDPWARTYQTVFHVWICARIFTHKRLHKTKPPYGYTLVRMFNKRPASAK